jgi:hypothetical protein
LLLAQAFGIAPRFARHELHQLPPPKTQARTRYVQDDGDLSGEWGNHEPRSPLQLEILSACEVVNLLRRCRYDRWQRLQIACIARAAGLSRETLYVAMNTGKMSEPTRAALTPVLKGIADGTIEFRRHGQVWKEVGH